MITADMSTFASVGLSMLYTVRFELLFLVGVCALWATGLLMNLSRSSTLASSNKTPPSRGRRDAAESPPVEGLLPARREPWRAVSTSQSSRGSSATTQCRELVDLCRRMPEPWQLRNGTDLVPKLVQLCQTQVQRAAEIYRAAIIAGMDLRQVPQAERDQLLMALVTALIRMGLVQEVKWILTDLNTRDIAFSSSLQMSTVKLCLAKHLFQECLTFSDLLAANPNAMPLDRTTLSCLLSCAIESRTYHRCLEFFDQLRATGTPSQKDFWQMIRFASQNGDWQLILELIREMREIPLVVDSVIYNTALATCVAADQMSRACILLDEMHAIDGVTDVITYNTVLKGFAKFGDMDACFKFYEKMRARDLAPSQITYGILLDACVNLNQVDKAAQVYEDMSQAGCPMNTVLYTTMIKGFTREGKVDEAMRVYEQMSVDKDNTPDLITFSILLKANCDAGRLDRSLELLDAMLAVGLQPDEVVFNNLLSGCAKKGNVELAKRLYGDMIAASIKPSNATFSILIRLYSQSKLLDEAVEMLRTEPALHRVELEPRCFCQLVQCCIRARRGRLAVEVYQMLILHSPEGAKLGASTLGMCVKLNMFDTAAELMELAASKGVYIDARDANLVFAGARRKRRDACAASCAASMHQLGIDVQEVRPEAALSSGPQDCSRGCEDDEANCLK